MRTEDLKEFVEIQFKQVNRILEDMAKHNKDAHEGIIKRQDYTNGSVKDHTQQISDLKQTDKFIFGGLKVFTLIAVVIILPICSWIGVRAINTLEELKAEIMDMKVEINEKVDKDFVADAIEENNNNLFIFEE